MFPASKIAVVVVLIAFSGMLKSVAAQAPDERQEIRLLALELNEQALRYQSQLEGELIGQVGRWGRKWNAFSLVQQAREIRRAEAVGDIDGCRSRLVEFSRSLNLIERVNDPLVASEELLRPVQRMRLIVSRLRLKLAATSLHQIPLAHYVKPKNAARTQALMPIGVMVPPGGTRYSRSADYSYRGEK